MPSYLDSKLSKKLLAMAPMNRSKCTKGSIQCFWNRDPPPLCPSCYRAQQLREYQKLLQEAQEYEARVWQEWLDSKRKEELAEYEAQEEAWSKVTVEECREYVARVEEGKERLVESTFHRARDIVEKAAESAQSPPSTSESQPKSNNQSALDDSISKEQAQSCFI